MDNTAAFIACSLDPFAASASVSGCYFSDSPNAWTVLNPLSDKTCLVTENVFSTRTSHTFAAHPKDCPTFSNVFTRSSGFGLASKLHSTQAFVNPSKDLAKSVLFLPSPSFTPTCYFTKALFAGRRRYKIIDIGVFFLFHQYL
jgi:hypothetical protein